MVGGLHISKVRFDELMGEAKANFEAQGQPFPKAGTSDYASIRSEAVTLLVQQAETQADAAKLGITVTTKDSTRRWRRSRRAAAPASSRPTS